MNIKKNENKYAIIRNRCSDEKYHSKNFLLLMNLKYVIQFDP